MCRLLLEHVKQRRAERPELTAAVVNITLSPAFPNKNEDPLAARFAKAAASFHTQAIAGMGRHLAASLFGEERIRVNTINLGPLQGSDKGPDPTPTKASPNRRRLFKHPDAPRRVQVPLGRASKVNDIKGPLLLLASEAGSFLTGQTLQVDGGAGVASAQF